ncbi:malto-oligosyltrehalose synthase [Actinocorallia longicatena]|uniref:Malto-oligosyltrehalose synthase n=1 Tax=Actinocorallia longicatena TaxID=111803 RepID=A0ABP6QKT2_9ACTN
MSEAPSATYRLQLTPSFGFAAAAAIAPYLADLGVSHVYLSPILQAVPGSEHGYDVADHAAVDADRGGEDGYRAMVAEFRAHGLGVVVDIVPNHMAFQSAMAADVAEHGWESPYAHWFDWEGDRLVVPGQGVPNYRRFFDISGLIGLRQEDERVFEATHALLFRLAAEGLIDGLRIDHVDGLADPGAYLEQLRSRFDGWIVVEKILTGDEALPEGWPGTTGYETAVAVDGLFTDPLAEATFTTLYTELTGGPADFAEVAAEGKRHVIERGLAPEVDRLHRMIRELLPQGDPDELRTLLVGSLVEFPAYRSYDQAQEVGWREFGTRFQQTTSALTARGLEDTAFYRWSRLTSRNEVGGEPARFSVDPEAFHRDCNTRFGAGMTTLSTHDTKRQEDVRARLAVLTELPGEWEEFVRARCDGISPADRDLDYLMWQTLVGAWPLDAPRLTGYLTKAMREAKAHTDWIDTDEAYEKAVLERARKALADEGVPRFAASLAPYERSNVLSQKLIQLTMPGVPDLYQGCELTGYSLVDPDNRRAVDYDRRRALLAGLDGGAPPRDLDTEKLLVTSRALRLRRENPGWSTSFHVPLTAEGPAADHVVAFRRGDAVTVATRLPAGLARTGGWHDTVLPLSGRWRDVLTGRPHGPLKDLLATYPVALLIPEEHQ